MLFWRSVNLQSASGESRSVAAHAFEGTSLRVAVPRLRAAAAAVAFLVLSMSCGGSPPVSSTRPPVPELTASAETLTVEEIRALTREEVENLTPEQLWNMDIEAAFDDGFPLEKLPLDLRFAWTEKGFTLIADAFKVGCCDGFTTEELVEDLKFTILKFSVLESLEYLNRNENDFSTPTGAFCWAFRETYRSYNLHLVGYLLETMFDLSREELLARAERGDAEDADAVRGMPSEPPSGEYPFADALMAADDPRVRGTAFEVADPVLLEAVEVFYDLVDNARQDEVPSPYAFMAEFLPYIGPGAFQRSFQQQPVSEYQALDPEEWARESLFIQECKDLILIS